jgi:hypothetical protein
MDDVSLLGDALQLCTAPESSGQPEGQGSTSTEVRSDKSFLIALQFLCLSRLSNH